MFKTLWWILVAFSQFTRKSKVESKIINLTEGRNLIYENRVFTVK